jgi:uncharacterized membrane protein YhaH (DUF805 family)
MWDWVYHCFDKYAVFEGRASRPEYWYFYLFNICVSVMLYASSFVAGDFRIFLGLATGLITTTPTLSVSSRRLHDTGHSVGWVVAQLVVGATLVALRFATRAGLRLSHAGALRGVLLLAFFGLSILVIILLARKGDAGPNRYGEPAPTTPNGRATSSH